MERPNVLLALPDGELAATFLVSLVGHDIVGIVRVVPNPESRRARVSLVVSLCLTSGLASGRRLGKAQVGSKKRAGEDSSTNEQLLNSHFCECALLNSTPSENRED